MDFGSVVLEHRPVVICQCKFELCALCSMRQDVHPNNSTCTCGHLISSHLISSHEVLASECTEEGCDCTEWKSCTDHNFYQRAKVHGPRVVISQNTKSGKCNDCGREYIIDIHPVNNTPGSIDHKDVVPY